MRNEQNFTNEIRHGHAALETGFKCDCGNETFFIHHSGLLHKGIFGGISLRKRKKQLRIKCLCSQCAKEYLLFDSAKDGDAPKEAPDYEFHPLDINGETVFGIKLRFNFLEENFKTDRFEMFFLDIRTPKSDEYFTICEI